MLRVEKGHVTGAELNGMTTAADLGYARMVSGKKDFIGRVLAGRPGLMDQKRPALVGVKPVDRNARLNPGAHFLSRGAEVKLANDQGYVTSAAYSATQGCWLGLGFLTCGRERLGERVRAYDPLRNSDIVLSDRDGMGIVTVLVRKGQTDALAQRLRERDCSFGAAVAQDKASAGEAGHFFQFLPKSSHGGNTQTTPQVFDTRERVSIYQPEQGGLIFPSIRKFSSFAEERKYRKERLVAGCRAFALEGYDYGFAGHLTVRDPEHTELYWTNPMAIHFA